MENTLPFLLRELELVDALPIVFFPAGECLPLQYRAGPRAAFRLRGGVHAGTTAGTAGGSARPPGG